MRGGGVSNTTYAITGYVAKNTQYTLCVNCDKVYDYTSTYIIDLLIEKISLFLSFVHYLYDLVITNMKY